MAPPKKILAVEQTLYDAQCVPGALLHFASELSSQGPYLNQEIMNQISTASAAAAAAAAERHK